MQTLSDLLLRHFRRHAEPGAANSGHAFADKFGHIVTWEGFKLTVIFGLLSVLAIAFAIWAVFWGPAAKLAIRFSGSSATEAVVVRSRANNAVDVRILAAGLSDEQSQVLSAANGLWGDQRCDYTFRISTTPKTLTLTPVKYPRDAIAPQIVAPISNIGVDTIDTEDPDRKETGASPGARFSIIGSGEVRILKWNDRRRRPGSFFLCDRS